MKYPLIPHNEKERIEALNSYDILDSLPEEDYDSITRIAALICNTPVALINMIDSKRSFLKSVNGLTASDSPREFSFCAHAINNPSELMIVNDSRKDDRFADNPFVTGDPHVIFYAGMPLVTADGYALGSICVMDYKPSELNKEQQFALKSLSHQVMQLMELRRKNRQLNEYQNKLEAHAADMESFAYMASHDLKDPLRMMSIFLQKLKKNHSEVLNDTAKEYVDFSINASIKMTMLVNDLLSYAVVDKNNMVKEDVNVSELISEIISYHSVLFKEANAVISYDALPHIQGSKTVLKIVLQNLLMNAVKFRNPAVPFSVAISIKETEQFWVFKIADNGIGIDVANHDEIFKPFKSLQPQSLYKGSGLGLAACKKIIEQHGGKIWVESEVGKGSTFYFEIIK